MMNTLFFLLVAVGIFTILLMSRKKPQTIEIPSNAKLVDVRSSEEYASGSVPNAINVPLDLIESRIGDFDKADHIVVFCRSGNRSKRAKSILESRGFLNVVNGGSWKEVVTIVNSKEEQKLQN